MKNENKEINTEDALSELRGSLSQINSELDSFRKFLYQSDDSLMSKMKKQESKIEEITNVINSFCAKYESLNSENVKGQWGLMLLLATTLLSWLAQCASWLFNRG